MSIGSCTLVPGMAFEVTYLIWKVSCLETMVTCLECIIGELKLSMDMVPLRLEVAALVIDLTIALNLCKRVPALLVHHTFVEGMEGRGRAHEEIVELGGHGISGI